MAGAATCLRKKRIGTSRPHKSAAGERPELRLRAPPITLIFFPQHYSYSHRHIKPRRANASLAATALNEQPTSHYAAVLQFFKWEARTQKAMNDSLGFQLRGTEASDVTVSLPVSSQSLTRARDGAPGSTVHRPSACQAEWLYFPLVLIKKP